MPPRLEKAIAVAVRRVSDAVDATNALLPGYLDPLGALHQRQRDDLDRRLAALRGQLEAAERDGRDAAEAARRATRNALAARIAEVTASAPWALADFDDPIWRRYRPEPIAHRAGVRIGTIDLGAERPGLPAIPAIVDVLGDRHLLLSASGDALEAARSMLAMAVLRTVLSAAPGAVRLALVDPATHGRALSGFLRLPPALRLADTVAVSPREIDDLIARLAEHVVEVTQRRLSNRYDSIEQYNAATTGVSVAYHVLAVADFPAGFTERGAEQLVMLARGGPPAGVHIVATVDTSAKLPRGFALADLSATATTVRLKDGESPLTADQTPAPDRMNSWLDALGAAALEVSDSLPFHRVAVPEDERWSGSSTNGIEVLIGVDPRGEPHGFVLGRGFVHHALVGGDTQRGKSNLLQVLITQLALRYPPEELELHLLDFKQVEFQRFLVDRLPHARVVASEADREYGVSALRAVQAEIDRRATVLKKAGQSHFRDYRRETGDVMPRLLVIVDEFQELFLHSDEHATAAGRLLTDIVKRGAAFGLHLLMATQSPRSGDTLSYLKGMYEQMGLRIALGCREPGVSYAILGDGNDAATRLRKPGEAVYDDQGGTSKHNSIIRIAELPNRERSEWSQAVTALAGDRSYPAPAFFDPSATAEITDHPRCRDLLAAAHWPAPGPTVDVWLGEPIEMKEPTAATFERDIASNLLVLGGDQDGYRILGAAILSIAVQLSPDDVSFVVADFARSTSAFRGYFEDLAAHLPHQVSVAGPRSAVSALDDLIAVLDERAAAPRQPHPNRFFLIAGLHRWQDLIGEYGRRSPAGDRLARLADEGPECGIHLIAWCEGLSGLDRALGHEAIRLFYLRTVMRLAEAESLRLLGSPIGARLTGRRGLLQLADAEPGRAEKFKPYAPPALESFASLARRLDPQEDHP
jgi:DNA segregation ATPase FtsK/SpoIIIE, S-DNA-T family